MTRYEAIAFLVLASSLGAGSLAQASDCECPQEYDPDRPPGTIWRGKENLTLEDIAAICAPALWFSSDEPAILLGGGKGVPNVHPCDDEPTDSGVVYYQPRIIRLRNGRAPLSEPFETAPDLLEKVYSLALRYYFYYDQDFGLDGHQHDVELAEFQIALETAADGCHQLRILRVECFAHGVDWYNNIIEATPEVDLDARVPLRILVEEAKHATCPDRNGDGQYTPGYDVNVRINDAWGVRDVLASGVLLGGGYNATMSKRREPEYMIMPPERPDLCRNAARYEPRLFEKHYELRPGSQLVMCANLEHGQFLAELMEKHGLGSNHKPEQYEAVSLQSFAEPFSKPGSIIGSLNYRYDGFAYSGVSLLLRGLDGGEIWLVPKINMQYRAASFEALLTKSASRWVDGYLTLGIERLYKKTADVDGETITVRDGAWEGAVETGVKFRFRTPSMVKPIFFWYDFAGMRFGVRTNKFDTLENLRFTYEIGAGVW